jgi:hypothetical protein
MGLMINPKAHLITVDWGRYDLTNFVVAVLCMRIITMKRKRGKRRGESAAPHLTHAEWTELRRYRSDLVEMLSAVHVRVGDAPPEMNLPKESIQGLLMASFYLLDVNEGLREVDDAHFIRSAIQELEKALGPLGLGVDYWDKIQAWRARDQKERGETDFLVLE